MLFVLAGDTVEGYQIRSWKLQLSILAKLHKKNDEALP